MSRLLLFFIGLPLVELYLLGIVSGRIGFFATLILVLVTGSLGATLTRRQGLSVLRRVQADLAAGRIPASALLDGIIILIAGALLITPGILSDIFGFLCLLPGFRATLRKPISRYFKQAMARGQVQFMGSAQSQWSSPYSGDEPHKDRSQDPSGPIIDIEVKEIDQTKD